MTRLLLAAASTLALAGAPGIALAQYGGQQQQPGGYNQGYGQQTGNYGQPDNSAQGSYGPGMQSGDNDQGYGAQNAGADDQGSFGAPLFISPEDIRAIQIKLNNQGYRSGPPDGQWGPDTSSAIRQFQQSRGLDATGQLDVSTIVAIGIPTFGNNQAANMGGYGNAGGQSGYGGNPQGQFGNSGPSGYYGKSGKNTSGQPGYQGNPQGGDQDNDNDNDNNNNQGPNSQAGNPDGGQSGYLGNPQDSSQKNNTILGPSPQDQSNPPQ